MIPSPQPPLARRAVAYITHGDRLLVFRHTQYPEAGIQVPGGTIEDGETPERWLHDETDPSDGSPGPYEFEFYWVRFPDEIPALAGEQGMLLHRLAQAMGA